jgi:hypothetical protein
MNQEFAENVVINAKNALKKKDVNPVNIIEKCQTVLVQKVGTMTV